jgi:glyoxylase-like metal-dependent hydrolase (beta-lactamase superfamily II)
VSAADGSLVLSNPGASAHTAHLESRLESLKLSIKDIKQVILTSLDSAKVGGVALLRRRLPSLQVLAPTPLATALADEALIRELWRRDQALSAPFKIENPASLNEFRDALRVDKPLADSQTIDLGEQALLRCVYTPGYRSHSASYIVMPHEFLITDETFGYYRGRLFATPGGNFQLSAASSSLQNFEHMEISGVGLPYVGAITGSLIRKHIESVIQNTSDITEQAVQGILEGFSRDEVREQLREAFFVTTNQDPFFQSALTESFEAIWAQISAAVQASSANIP